MSRCPKYLATIGGWRLTPPAYQLIQGKFRAGLVDAGYFSEENMEKDFPDKLELFCATKKDWKQRKAMRKEKSPRGRIPVGLSVRGANGTKAINKAREAVIQETWANDRSGVWSDKRGSWNRSFCKTRVKYLCKRVEVDLCYA
ncbi:MAG: hypothetical protein MRJ65_14300 [Candidatus Brocadiaceae bacterium]|nr:hypothetical protein [Candidatus Brocadiaceae bacterium]